MADYEKLKAKGVEVIACTAVNDAFVMAAWGESQNATGKIHMLADASGEFAKVRSLFSSTGEIWPPLLEQSECLNFPTSGVQIGEIYDFADKKSLFLGNGFHHGIQVLGWT